MYSILKEGCVSYTVAELWKLLIFHQWAICIFIQCIFIYDLIFISWETLPKQILILKTPPQKILIFSTFGISSRNNEICIRSNHCLGQSKANQSQIASRMSSCQLGLAYRFVISCQKASFLSTMVLSNVSKLTFQQNSCLQKITHSETKSFWKC